MDRSVLLDRVDALAARYRMQVASGNSFDPELKQEVETFLNEVGERFPFTKEDANAVRGKIHYVIVREATDHKTFDRCLGGAATRDAINGLPDNNALFATYFVKYCIGANLPYISTTEFFSKFSKNARIVSVDFDTDEYRLAIEENRADANIRTAITKAYDFSPYERARFGPLYNNPTWWNELRQMIRDHRDILVGGEFSHKDDCKYYFIIKEGHEAAVAKLPRATDTGLLLEYVERREDVAYR